VATPPPPADSAAAYGAPPIAPPVPPPAPPPPPPQPDEAVLSNATIVRSLKEFTEDYGLVPATPSTMTAVREASDVRLDKRKALDEAYATRIFGSLTRLARLLITAESVETVLEQVLNIAFDSLPVDRGFILLRDEQSGELVCEVMRTKDGSEFRPKSEVPISRTMLETVMHERVALLTYDALSDQRLAGTESVRIHQIRAAMCAPLWSGEKIIGVMQVDTPHHAGSFIDSDVDFLTTLANYCAVAIERILNANKANFERQARSRLERYPASSRRSCSVRTRAKSRSAA
jgi:transcriptional regulator with GAF, ATPase, and Fis domain